jgi:hypothetical protein
VVSRRADRANSVVAARVAQRNVAARGPRAQLVGRNVVVSRRADRARVVALLDPPNRAERANRFVPLDPQGRSSSSK